MYNLHDISKLITTRDVKIHYPEHEIKHLLIDSRKLLFPESSLFFAFFGKQTDGHLFIKEVHDKGVRSFVIEDRNFDHSPYPDSNFLIVDHAISALQELTSSYRKNFNFPVIGITGSNGKTIIKEWIYQLLEDTFRIMRSPGSYNSQIGVPLSVWQMDKKTDFAIIEAGISRTGEMQALSEIIAPDIGIFTNLGDAHSSGFANKEEKLNEKLKLFHCCKKIIFDLDEGISSEAIARKFAHIELAGWSFSDPSATLYISSMETKNGHSQIIYTWRGSEGRFKIPFKDPVSIRMAIFSLLSALELGGDQSELNSKLESLSAINMRLEVKDGFNNCLLINDSYNADLTSFKQALQFLSLQDENLKKVLVLSDFFQIGMDSESLNVKLARLIDMHDLSKLILVGEEVAGLKKYLTRSSAEVFQFNNTDNFEHSLNRIDFQNECILLKGARKFKFERIFVKLSSRYHSTVLEINLDSTVQNLQVYRSFIKPETKVMAVIKASGYGAGSVKLARHLEKNNVNYFSVAFVDEGIELRKGGVKNPIMVFNSDLAFLPEMIDYQLEPVVFNFESMDYIARHAPEGLGVHLKLDSGLNRLGFQENNWDKLCEKITEIDHIRILSIFSHFSASPNPKYDDFSHHQAAVFQKGFDKVVKVLNYRPIQHLLNSAGVVKFNEYQFDMVRIGSGIHGIDTSNTISNALQVVHTLKARINMIKTVKAGDSIGYERMGISDRVKKIAIIPIGYADGLVRKAGNYRYSFFLNGSRVPIVGNVNMDMTMIDITDVKNVEPGDEVEIFGRNISIKELAFAGDTIFYEILSRISPRVKRIYTFS